MEDFLNKTPVSRRNFLKLSAAGTFSLICATGAAGASLSGCSRAEVALISGTAFNFNTMISIQAACEQNVLDKAFERCNYFESIFSRTIDTSDISKINSSNGKAVEVANETAEILTLAKQYAQQSNGLFDITIGSVTPLWNYSEGIVADEAKLAEAAKHINWQNLNIDGNAVTLSDPEAKLDLGGIAKGYIADDLADFFVNNGCNSALINLGGNVYALGTKPDGSDWSVGIENPFNLEDKIGSVDSKNSSTVASGIYQQEFEKDGKLYHHLLDAATGRPHEGDIESITLITEKSVDGDVWATTLFLMDAAKALEIINSRDDLSGLIVLKDGTILKSDDCPINA